MHVRRTVCTLLIQVMFYYRRCRRLLLAYICNRLEMSNGKMCYDFLSSTLHRTICVSSIQSLITWNLPSYKHADHKNIVSLFNVCMQFLFSSTDERPEASICEWNIQYVLIVYKTQYFALFPFKMRYAYNVLWKGELQENLLELKVYWHGI